MEIQSPKFYLSLVVNLASFQEIHLAKTKTMEVDSEVAVERISSSISKGKGKG